MVLVYYISLLYMNIWLDWLHIILSMSFQIGVHHLIVFETNQFIFFLSPVDIIPDMNACQIFFFFFPACLLILTYTYIESQVNRSQWSQRFLDGVSRRPKKKKKRIDGGLNPQPLAPQAVLKTATPRRPRVKS